MPGSGAPYTALDYAQVIRQCFDESTDSLRTTATATIVTPPAIEVIISHTSDSIRLGDGTYLFTGTQWNSKVGLDVNILGVQTPTITNVSAATAGIEYSHTLPAGTKRFILKSRQSGILRIAYSSGATSTNYITVSGGAIYSEEDLTLDVSKDIFFRSTKNSDVIEVLSWL